MTENQAPVELTSEEIDQVSGGVSLLFVPIVAKPDEFEWGFVPI